MPSRCPAVSALTSRRRSWRVFACSRRLASVASCSAISACSPRSSSCWSFLGVAQDAPLQLPVLALHVIDACALHLSGLGRLGGALVERLPLGLPVVHGLLDFGQALRAQLRRRLKLLMPGHLLGQADLQLAQAGLVPDTVVLRLLERRLELAQLLALLGQAVAHELDRLLQARDVRADRVVTALHLVEPVVGLDVALALAVDLRLQAALSGQCGLHGRILLLDAPLVSPQLLVQATPAQGQQLGLQAALGLLVFLVFLGGRRLALEMAQLLLDLLAQVIEPLQVLPGMADSGLGLAPALLVLGDPRRFLQKQPQVLGPRLDETRDHALLDDGVAARTQSGAEKQILHVAAPTAHTVQKIARLAVPRHLALHGDLGIAGVLTPGTAIGVVEQQLDGGGAHRLATGGAVEDNVGHRLAAQRLRRHLAHHPAHCVDDVGLAATVGPDDPYQVARKQNNGRVDKGFEARELDLFQAHGPLRYPQQGHETSEAWRDILVN